VSSEEITAALNRPLSQIITMVKSVLEEIPPELSSDIIDKGIVMSGGTSQLTNLDKLLTDQTGVPCYVAEEPELCVVKGTGVAMEHIDVYKRSLRK
jgi:rod shape-determining protein MreB